MSSHQNIDLSPQWTAEHTAAPSVPTTGLPRLVGSIPPYSMRAAGVAIVSFSIALLVQIGFRSIGGSLMFSTYFPAVLVAGLLAGLPAGVFLTIARC